MREDAQDTHLDHSDFDIPSLSCSNDSWEALYLRERKLCMTLQQKLSALRDNLTSCVPELTHSTKLPEVIEDVDPELDDIEIKESNSFFANGKDDYGLMDANSPTLMFGEDESTDKVDLLALAALNDKEKETTDDEGDHIIDEENDDKGTSGSHVVSPTTIQVKPQESQHVSATPQGQSHDVFDTSREDECSSLRQTIEKQQEVC